MNDFDLSVCCLSFSKADGGSLLVAIDEAPDHNISIWDWQKGENGYKITETKVSCFLLMFIFYLIFFSVFSRHNSRCRVPSSRPQYCGNVR